MVSDQLQLVPGSFWVLEVDFGWLRMVRVVADGFGWFAILVALFKMVPTLVVVIFLLCVSVLCML